MCATPVTWLVHTVRVLHAFVRPRLLLPTPITGNGRCVLVALDCIIRRENRGNGFYRCLRGDRERKNNCAAGREKPVWRQLRAAFVSNYGQWGGLHRACISAAVCGWSRGLARENMIRSLSARKTNSGAVFPTALFWILVFHSINARTAPERVNMCPGGGCTC